ncbi:hypothetical protein P170DRAFT_371378, partial [Aspergillus steynii IBT 23096]
LPPGLPRHPPAPTGPPVGLCPVPRPTRQAPSTSLYSPQAPPRQLVWRWATPGPFDQAPDHPGPPRAFSVRRHPPRTFCPGPLPARRGTPSPATPPRGHMRVRGQGRVPRKKSRLPSPAAPSTSRSRWPTGPAPGQTAKPPVRPGEWVPLRPTGSGFRQRRRTPRPSEGISEARRRNSGLR